MQFLKGNDSIWEQKFFIYNLIRVRSAMKPTFLVMKYDFNGTPKTGILKNGFFEFLSSDGVIFQSVIKPMKYDVSFNFITKKV